METVFNVIKAIVLGVVEGITEWLPISSTGHMILVNDLIHLRVSDAFMEAFEVVIQLGAILAVLLLYWGKLNPFSPRKTALQRQDTWQMWFKVIVACLPAAVIGLLLDDTIDALFYNSWTVSITLVVYGVLFILLERRHKAPKTSTMSEMTYTTALLIGAFQVLALIPGTSRSGATILGAVFLGASRPVAAEFSFFLSIPVMVGASLLKMLKYGKLVAEGTEVFGWNEGLVLLTGMVVAFAVSVLAIRFLMSYIKKHDFKAFGYYRIVLGLIVIAYFLLAK